MLPKTQYVDKNEMLFQNQNMDKLIAPTPNPYSLVKTAPID